MLGRARSVTAFYEYSLPFSHRLVQGRGGVVLLGLCSTRCVWVRIFEQSVPCGVKVLHHFVVSMGTWDGPRTFVSVFVDILICVCYCDG